MRKSMEKIKMLLKSKADIIYVTTHEEEEFIKDLRQLIIEEMPSVKMKSWSATSGLRNVKTIPPQAPDPSYRDIHRVLDYVIEAQNKSIEEASKEIIIFKDAHVQLEKIATTYRAFRDAKEGRSQVYVPLVIVSPVVYIPNEMEKLVTVVDYDFLERNDLEDILDNALMQIQNRNKNYIMPNEEQKEKLIRALSGLTAKEVSRAIRQSIIKNNDIVIEEIIEQKMQLIKKSGVLDYSIPKAKFEEVGGNDAFKAWVEEVELAMSPEAKKFGCSSPKGYLALGLPGTSKTFMAEALANKFGIPFLKMEMNRIMNKLVGESEKKIDQAFQVAKACAPCIMLWDEIEKILGGVKSSNASDAGTTSRIFAKCLQFLQDDNNVFVVMTSNDVSQLPPELTRSGRLDALWYFTLPTLEERIDIFKIHLDKTGKSYDASRLKDYAEAANKYTGAEIQNIIKSSVWKAFKRYKKDGVDKILAEDILSTIPEIIPIYQSSQEKVNFLDQWVKGRARYSSNQIVDKDGFFLGDDDEIDLDLEL